MHTVHAVHVHAVHAVHAVHTYAVHAVHMHAVYAVHAVHMHAVHAVHAVHTVHINAVSIYAVDDLIAVWVDAFLLPVSAVGDDALKDAMVENCCINFTHDLKLLSALSIKCSRT